MSKKSFNFVAVILATVTVIGLSSCKDKVYYSCDPTINRIIKQDLPRYENMTREEWKTLPDSLKDAAFVAMTPETKKEFWLGKQKEMLSSKIFNDAEKRHISKLYDYLLNIDVLFTDTYSRDLKRVQKDYDFYKEWAIYGLDNFKWDVLEVIMIAEDREELTKDYIEFVRDNTDPQKAPATSLQQAGGTECNCLSDIYCDRKMGTLCESKCDVKVKKCGLFGGSECKYKCYEPKGGNGGIGGVVTSIDKERLDKLEQFNNMTQKELLEYMFLQYKEQ